MTRAIGVLLVVALAAPAAADSGKLAEAKAALDDVRFADAQRLLVGALADGGNTVTATRELYRLSASTAVALGQRDVAEQYYRKWLAIDSAAALGGDVAPKLREPFEAAQAFIAAHGRLAATAARTKTGEIEVVVTQPLPMAAAVAIIGGPSVPLTTELRAHLPIAEMARPAVVVDDRGNQLLELVAPPPGSPQVGRDRVVAGPESPTPAPSRTWLKLAIPSAILLVAGVGLGVAASSEGALIEEELANSGAVYFDDLEARHKRRDIFIYAGAGALAVGVALAIPAVVLYLRSRDTHVVPVTGDGATGVAVLGRF